METTRVIKMNFHNVKEALIEILKEHGPDRLTVCLDFLERADVLDPRYRPRIYETAERWARTGDDDILDDLESLLENALNFEVETIKAL